MDLMSHPRLHAFAYGAVTLIGTILATLLIHLVHLLLHKRYGQMRTGEHVWRDALVRALNAPVQAIVWVIGASTVEAVLTPKGRVTRLAEMFRSARDVALVAIVAWFSIRLIRRVMENLQTRATKRGRGFDQTAAGAIRKSLTALIVVIASLTMMRRLGFPVATLLAFGGVAGIALGFAAQGLVANLLGGITIYASRPFKVGDHIILPGANPATGYVGWQAGEVQHIGWRATRILDWNGKPFYVPNAKFNTETIINHSRMAFREISEYVYVRLEDIDKVAAIVAEVNRMLEEHPAMGDYLVFRFDSYGEYALKLYLYAYTSSAVTAYIDYMRVKEDVLLAIASIVARHGAKLAVPVSNVYLPAGRAVQLSTGHAG
jgi:MscS family membrane protein